MYKREGTITVRKSEHNQNITQPSNYAFFNYSTFKNLSVPGLTLSDITLTSL